MNRSIRNAALYHAHGREYKLLMSQNGADQLTENGNTDGDIQTLTKCRGADGFLVGHQKYQSVVRASAVAAAILGLNYKARCKRFARLSKGSDHT